ncbi:hypothetical protein JTB14_010187 [Gonioctena quinquepunctata]|nr:hypothetical protein JTB14_010187 [Gonioctena quinquepunctata]
MEQDLKNAVLDEQDEEGSCSIHSKVYENVFLADEALEGKQREKSVTEWVKNIPQDEPHDIPKGDNKTRVQNFTEIKMLCETLTNVLNSWLVCPKKMAVIRTVSVATQVLLGLPHLRDKPFEISKSHLLAYSTALCRGLIYGYDNETTEPRMNKFLLKRIALDFLIEIVLYTEALNKEWFKR